MSRSELRAQLPAVAESARVARRLLDDYLTRQALGPVSQIALLLMSELVTNSVQHGAGPIDIHVWRPPSLVRVEVSDCSGLLPALRVPGDGGRGLHVIAALSRTWGATRIGPSAKTTWFELASSADRDATPTDM